MIDHCLSCFKFLLLLSNKVAVLASSKRQKYQSLILHITPDQTLNEGDIYRGML